MSLGKTAALLVVVTLTHAAEAWKFDFGSDEPEAGWTAVHANERFTEEKGYGFDLKGGPLEKQKIITGEEGFYFSITAEPGNYLVRVKTGDPATLSDTTIKAESRRLMIIRDRHRASSGADLSFAVNVRDDSIGNGQRVKLKDREKPYLHWDHKLTLEFNGKHPAIDKLEILPAPEVITVFLLGDSTVTDQPYEPWNSWGQMLPVFFDETVAVANHAESGESVRSSLGAGRFNQVYQSMKPGDYVFIQFGHNDMKDKHPDAIDNYRNNLSDAVAVILEKGGNPVLVTSMERKSGVDHDTLGDYPETVRDVAMKTGATLIDLHRMSRELYQSMGDNLDAAFQDGTHHNSYGSYLLAGCVIEGIKTEIPKLAQHLRPDPLVLGPSIKPPDSSEIFAASPLTDLSKPDGD